MFRPIDGGGIEGAGPGRAAAMRNFSRIRDRLFYALFHKLSHTYAKVFPSTVRRCFEFIVFIKALCAIGFLIYMHTIFSNATVSCLEKVHNRWPKNDGILRLEVMNNLTHSPIMFTTDEQIRAMNLDVFEDAEPIKVYEYLSLHELNSTQCMNPMNDFDRRRRMPTSRLMEVLVDNSIYFEKEEKLTAEKLIVEPQLIFEYALEYGFLRLSERARKKLGIKVTTLRIDPDKDVCFGSGFSRYVRKEIIGVEDLLRNSFKILAFEEDNKQGYLRNVKSDEHFKFISVHTTRSSYIAAAFVMILFTLSISMLLRYSHHQIFIFIIDVLQMLELNVGMVFPAAPLLTVILALVGIEAIMSEFFSDSTTAFYIIIIVWVADQYEAICCHTAITKRHWLRFFYLYHFAFYAYHYRFNGQYSGLALVASWLLIQHSMLYFFHHYELPAVLNRTTLIQNQNNRPNQEDIINAQPNPNGSPDPDQDEEESSENYSNSNNNNNNSSNTASIHVNSDGSNTYSNNLSPPHSTHNNTTSTNSNSLSSNFGGVSIMPSLSMNEDPTSLEYIEHLLEELIPARNGMIANNQQIEHASGNESVAAAAASNFITNNLVSNVSVRGAAGSHSVEVSQTTDPNVTVSNSQSVITTARGTTTTVSNIALYPFQRLIVSLLIRLLNFIQTGSPRRAPSQNSSFVHSSNPQLMTSPAAGSQLHRPNSSSIQVSSSGDDVVGFNRHTSLLSMTNSVSSVTATSNLFCLSNNSGAILNCSSSSRPPLCGGVNSSSSAQRHRRTQSATNIMQRVNIYSEHQH